VGRVGRGFATVALAVALGLNLAACAIAPPDLDAPPSQPPAPSDPVDTEPTAIVSIAAVDVDGEHITVAGFVTELAEDGGSCLFILTSEITNARVDASTTGVENVTTTSCGSTQVAVADLSRGPWQVVLEYRSDQLETTSEPLAVEVP
jgi:hypothetical protein